MIYVAGDSHTQIFQGNSGINGPLYNDHAEGFGEHKNKFKVIHLDSPTAYNAYKRIDEINTKLTDFNKETDYLFFSFGEIDVRCHLGFQSEKQNKNYLKHLNFFFA